MTLQAQNSVEEAEINWEEIKTDWLTDIDRLFEEVKTWIADRQNWKVEESITDIQEERLGQYQAPVLTLIAPEGRLVMEPIARIVFGGQGTVEFYAWPTLNRVRLLRIPTEDQMWRILTDSGIFLRDKWSKETLFWLADNMLHTE